nr:MAG TPA: hypothetical protein [Caudoviricetes sp.]
MAHNRKKSVFSSKNNAANVYIQQRPDKTNLSSPTSSWVQIYTFF